jgi:myo-inositol-1(or 4)-monophosphatase
MDDYLKTAIELAHYAGEVMLSNFNKAMQRDWKADETPVTVSDRQINNHVLSTIQEKYSSHSVLGEEESQNNLESEYLWVCDPIDGTFPFSHGIPVSTFSLALVKEGKPLLGILYDPFMDRLYSAIEGKGAFLNNERIYVSSEIDKRPLIGMDWWAANGSDMLDVVGKLHHNSFTVMTLYSGAYQGALVASGKLSAYIGATDKPYDIAAQKIVIEEAGGKTSSLDGKNERCDKPVNGFVAAHPVLHQKLLEFINSK